MIETLLVGGLAGILTAIVISLLALSIQKRTLNRLQETQYAWERAQETRQQQWQEQQEKHLLPLENRLLTSIERLNAQWQDFEAKDAERAENLRRQYELSTTQAHIEYELARLPHVEDTPLTITRQHHTATRWQAPRLQGADLSHRNLSSRYLGYADLRDSKLLNANLFMADLFRAWLAGANLTGADLSAANLTEADLRGAILTGANFQVADLNNTVLIGADLRGVRNLTLEQVQNAIFDDTTCFDDALAIHLPRAPYPQQRFAPFHLTSARE
ncbi:MAG: pentapeptide repeat-containing protein [Ktedonobacteraceae bacterium]|nr:pentapeptide repeat-containing protein [Ktedonobacteraceae bacterium]